MVSRSSMGRLLCLVWSMGGDVASRAAFVALAGERARGVVESGEGWGVGHEG